MAPDHAAELQLIELSQLQRKAHAMTEQTRYTLTSTPMIYTPGILTWAMAGARSGPKARRDMVRLVRDTYHLPHDAAESLVTGKTPHTVEGESIVFTY